MATSTLGFYTRFDESLVDDEDPVDTGLACRAINNLDHLADQYAQHRVNWRIQKSAQGLAIDASDTFNTTDNFFLYKSNAFDLHVREDGTSYRCGGWLYCHSGTGSFQAVFKAALVPTASGLVRPDIAIASAGVNTADCNRTSASFADEQLDALMYLDASMVGDAQMDVTTVDSIGGASVSVRLLSVQLYVYVSGNDLTVAPRLGGVRLLEYMPP